MAPAGTIVSLFSSRTSSLVESRECRRCCAAANPAFDGCSITDDARPSGPDRCGAAVGRGIVDDHDFVRCRRRRRRRATRGSSPDAFARCSSRSRWPASSSARSVRAGAGSPRRHDPRNRPRGRAGARDSCSSRRAARVQKASNGRGAWPSISPTPTYSAAGPYTSRATGVSSTTIGTPGRRAPRAGSGRSPRYSDRNTKTDARE